MNTIRKDKETKNLRKTIIKYSKDIPVSGDRYRGVFSINGYRVYDVTPNQTHIEVDVVFNGELKVSVSSVKGDEWYDSVIKKNEKYHVSPVKLGRFLRNILFKDINSHISYFNTEIKNQYAIKTIKWM
jgi:hypothetical protein